MKAIKAQLRSNDDKNVAKSNTKLFRGDQKREKEREKVAERGGERLKKEKKQAEKFVSMYHK
jgi:hypothetical protein